MSIADDTPDLNPSGFDPEFSQPPWVWAKMYRDLGWQVVPAYSPGETKGTYKRPMVEWAKLQDALVPDLTYERWYGTKGDHRDRRNMGILTGRCSSNVFVIDLDTHTHPEARDWWEALLAKHTGGEGIITPCQKTGGGGIQMLFRAPVGWLVPTNKTSIGVDIRGQGGFAMLPPCKHEKGEYSWLPGNEPWRIPVADAPGWLIEAVMEVVKAYGGASGAGKSRGERPEASGSEYNDWGRLTDLREDHMFRMVFVVVVKWHRELKGVEPFPPDWEPKSRAEYAIYEMGVEPTTVDPSKSKTELLDMEQRGWVEWHDKFKRCMNQWHTKIAQAAAQPPPDGPEPDPSADFKKAEEKAKATGDTFEYLNIEQILALADPKWLIDKLVIEQSLGFIYGPPGSLKTFIGLDIALSLVTKQSNWWGYPVQRDGTVVYISSEGHANLKFRIRCWEQHRKVPIAGAPFRLIRQSINFMKAEDVGKLLATVQAIADETIGRIAAVFVDTVSRVLPGAEENLQKDMTRFVEACDAVRNKFGATVIGIHHTNYAGGIRGSTVIPGAGDFLIETRREPGAMAGSVFAKKIKDAEDGWERFFVVNKIKLDDIVGHTSLVIDGVDIKPDKEGTKGFPDRNVCRQILAAIDEEWMNGKPWCFGKNSPRWAVRNIALRWSLDPKLVERMLANWVANKIIEECNRSAKGHIKGYQKLLDI